MKYTTIVADPPWHYPSARGATRGVLSLHAHPSRIEQQASVLEHRGLPSRVPSRQFAYPTMTVAQIEALPVATLAAPDAHLYLWTTNKYLPAAFGVVAAWGFQYGQTIIWGKAPHGAPLGGAFVQNAEFCLHARRGSPGRKGRADSVWFAWPRVRPHSRKPPGFYALVEHVSHGPYLELFARRHRAGWESWGNEVVTEDEDVSRILAPHALTPA